MKTSLNRTSSRRSNKQKRHSFFSALRSSRAARPARKLHLETLESRALLASFSNPAAITVNDFPPGTANPYPSTINFSLPAGVSASTVNATATLNSLSHTSIADVNVLLTAPGGQNVELMRFVGSGPVVNETYTFQDGAPSMPFIGDPGTGTFSPTQFGAAVAYPAPAPAGPYGTTMSAVVPSAPAGAWNLFVFDNVATQSGSIAGGWNLALQLGGDVVVNAGAAANNAADDSFLIRRSGANLQILVNAATVFDEPFAGITSLTINGSGDNDTLTVDFSAGSPLPAGLVTFNGGAGTADAMVLQGASFNTVRHFFTNATDGRVEFDGDTTDNGGIAETSIVYTGLDPIADNLNAANRVFDFGAGNDQDVVVRDNAVAGDGLNVIEAPANAESVTFTNPTASLTVNLGDGDDIMELRRLDSTWAAPTINLSGGNDTDEIRIAATPAGTTTNSNTNGGIPDRTILGAIVGSNGDDATDFAQFNTGVSTLDFIVGNVVSVDDSGGVGQLFVDDSGDVNADIVTFSANSITGAAPAAINYNGGNLDTVQLALGTAADTINVTGTGSSGSTTIFGNGSNDVFTIAGDALSANNSFQGGPGNDTFNLNIATHLGSTAAFAIASLVINGNDPAANSENRDRLNINDNNGGFARNLNFDHLDTAGDLDILPEVAGAGYSGPINAGLAVNVRGMETIVTTSTSDNDTVRVTGTSNDDNLTAVPRGAGQALVFLDGNPYLNTPPDSLATFLPGLAGGGRGPDLSLDGIAGSLTLDGGAVSGEGNRAIVQGVSENNITTGGALNIFGFGAGVLIPGAGAGNAYDTINVNDALVTISNIAQGPLTPVALVTASFNQTSPDTPFQRAGLIVNGGDEAVAQANGVADNISALISAVFNIQVNGNLPTLVLGPDGLPRGDQLNITGPGDINIFSDKATPPNVTVTFSNNPGPFGIRHSSIERLILDAGTLPASGAVNLIGDNNDPAVDQNDNYVVRGRDIDGNLLDVGYQEMTVSINGSAPILINGVQRLNAYGDDRNPPPGTPSVGPNDIDTLDIRAYADNGANPPNNSPRGWGVDVFFHEGNPVGADGNQADLLIYHTSAGLGGGGSVSENVVVQPSGPDNGEVRVTNAVDGSEIVVIQYVANTDIVVLDDDGGLADTDSLTLNGTNPDGPQTSGRETFAANFAAAGDLANPLVTVTDTASAAILYRLRNFTGFNSITLDPLGGGDTINLINRAGLTVNANGGSPTAIGAQNDALNMTVAGSARYTQGAVSTEGRIDNTGVGDVNFTGFETVGLTSTAAGGATFNARGTDDNDTIALDRLGTNDLVWINDGPVISFATFSAVTLDGRFGSDSFSITPDGIAVIAINVNGGDPTASDTAVVNGTAGADAIEYSPSGADSGTVQVNAAPVVNLATVEHLTINGLGGDDALTVNVLGGANVTQYTPGPVLDSGSLIAGNTLPLDFQNLGFAGSLTLDNAGGRVSPLVYNGTSASDLFQVDAAGTINLRTTIGGTTVPRSLPVLTPGIGAATLKGLDGDDSFDIVGNHPFAGGLTVDGGNPSASDTLNFAGSGGAITIDPTAGTITEAGFGPVSVTGIEHVNIDAAGGAIVVAGTAGDDTIAVSPTAPGAGNFSVAGNSTQFNYTDAASITVDGGAGDGDVVQVLGRAVADAITSPAANIVAVNGSEVTIGAGIERLEIHALAGNDTVTLGLGLPGVAKVVYAGEGNDTVDMTTTADADIFGGDGNDVLIGTALADYIDGGAGNDTISGLAGDDTLLGGADFDTIDPGTGTDVVDGGAGSDDWLLITTAATAIDLREAAGRLRVDHGGNVVLASDISQALFNSTGVGVTMTVLDLSGTDVDRVAVDFNGGGADTLIVDGTNLADNIAVGRDTINPAGNPLIFASLSWGRVGAGVISAAEGDRLVVRGRDGDDTITASRSVGDASIVAGSIGTALVTLEGGIGNDTLTIDSTAGQVGNAIFGNDGNDSLTGGAGNDQMDGGAGDDSFVGNGGTDAVGGGVAGALGDTIVVSGSPGNDEIALALNAAGHLLATINGVTTTYTDFVGGPIATAAIEAIRVDGLAGNDRLTVNVDAGAGSDVIGIPIAYHGGDGNDTLVVFGSPATVVDEVIYELGASPDRGRLTYEDAADLALMSIQFTGLEPVHDYVPANLTVFGNHAANAITYSEGPNSNLAGPLNPLGVETGLISVDAFETIEFGNKLDVTIDGRAGDDSINVVDAGNPGASGDLNLAEDNPTLDNEVVLTGTTGADVVNIEITGPHSAIVTINGSVTNVNTTARLTYNGLGGNDDLTIQGIVAGDNRFVFTPTGQPDAGTVTGVDRAANLNFLPVEFVQLGVGGQLTIDGNSVTATELVVLGTIGHDTLAVASATGDIALSTPQAGDHVTIATLDIQALRLEMLDGNDQIDLAFGLPYTALAINGGSPGAGSDVLNLVGAAGLAESVLIVPDLVNPTEQDVIGLGPATNVSGVELITFAGNAGDLDTLTVRPGDADDEIRVDDQVAGSVGRISSTVLPEIHFSNLETLAIDGTSAGSVAATFVTTFLPAATNYEFSGFAEDELIIEGTAGNDIWEVTNPLALGGSALVTDIGSGVAVRNSVGLGSPGDLVIRGLGGDDIVTVDVDFAGSNSDVLTGINLLTFDGGTGSDELAITGTPLTLVDELIYSPGPDITEGRLLYEDAANNALMTIDFLNLEPILDLVPVTTLTVNGTSAANAINYTAGTAPAGTGLISIDGFETIEFANKTNLVINGLAGSDAINLNNPTTPDGLATITVSGGDPTAGDTLVVNGNAGFSNNLLVSPTGAGSGTVVDTAAGSPFVQVTFAGVEQLDVIGQSTDSDALRLNGTAGDDTYDITPGPSIDEGLATGFSTGPGGFNFVPVHYAGFRNFLTFPEPPTAGNDTLIVNGTSGDDVFVYRESSAFPTFPIVSVNGSTEIFSGADTWVLRGLEGNDEFTVDIDPPTPGQPTFTPTTIVIEGGDSDPTSDTLHYIATLGAATTVNLEASTIETAGSPIVNHSGVERINLNANQGDVSVDASAGSDEIDITPTGPDDLEFTWAGHATLWNVTSILNFDIDGLAGTDTLTLHASELADVINADGDSVEVIGRQLIDYTTFELLEVLSAGGPDTINVTPSVATTMFIDGGLPAAGAPGVPSDLLNVLVPASTSITQGADATTGQIVTGGGAVVNFAAVEAVSLTSGDGGTLTVNATDDNDTIAAANLGANLVWVNDGPVIIVNGFSTLTLNGRFGNDNFSISPAGFGVTEINVSGGDPTASDTVVVNGTASVDNVTIDQLTLDGARISGLGPTVNVSTTEHLTYSGQGGDDSLTMVTPSGGQVVSVAPGALPGTGTISARHFSGGGGNPLIPVAFTGISANGALTFADVDGVRVDELQVVGTADSNSFFVGPAGIVVLDREAAGGTVRVIIDIATPGVAILELTGLDGDDVFTVNGNHPFTGGIFVDGGNPSASDVLNFFGSGAGAVAVDLAASTVTEAGFAPVEFSGVEIVNVDTNGNTLAISGTAGDDDLTVTPLSATAGKVELGLAVQQSGQVAQNVAKPLINYSGISGALAVDLLGGEDTLVVVGNALPQTFDVDAAGTVAIDDSPNGVGNDGLVTFTNTESLEAFGLEGADRFNVTAGLIPVFIDGGDPIGVTAVGQGDTIVPIGAIAFFPGPEPDEGGFLSAGEEISFDHIENIIIGPHGDCPFLILGTNGDDDITVVARNEQVINGTTFFPGADGVQDFTVSVNAGPDILFLDEPDLYIDALNGDDDIVIRAPAPNDADWDVNVRVAGGPPSIGETNDGDRLVLETPGTDSIVFTPTGPDTGNLVLDIDGNLVYDEGGTDSIITFGPFVFVCDDPVGEPIEFTYLSSPGGVELVEYDGELTDGAALDDITINGTALDDTTTVTPVGAGPGGSGQGSFVSPGSPLFNFRGYDDFSVNGGTGGFDTLIYNATAGADIITTDADTVTLAGTEVNLGLGLDQFELYSFGGNDNIDLDLQLLGLAKIIDAGAGNDIVDLSGVIVDPADPMIFGGIGDDTIIGSPNVDLIYGDDGNDTINGLGSDDVVHGGRGNDVLIGGAGADILFGEEGNDRFGDPAIADPTANDPGNDQFHGGDGSDTFVWDPGDGSDLIEGGDGIGDVLIFNGGAGVDTFTLTASSTRLLANRAQGAILLDTADVEVVNLNGLGGADSFTINDLYPTAVQVVNVEFGAADGAADAVTIAGRDVSDNVNVTPVAGIVEVSGLRYDVNVANATAGDGDLFTLNGNNGNDTIVSPLDESLLPHFAVANFTLSGGLGDDFVTGYGNLLGNEGADTLVGGNQGQLINGGDGDDQIFGGDGGDTLLGEGGEDTFVPGFDGATDSIDGGDDFDTILVQGNSANNRIDARQDAIGQVSYEVSGINGGDGVIGGAGTESDVIVPGTVEQLTILAGSGDDLIRVSHNDSLIANDQEAFSLRFTVDGGAPGASDRLTLTDEGLGDTTIHRVGGIAGNGSYAVGALAPVVYTDIEFASLNPLNPVTGGTGADGLGTLFVFKHDPFESNDSRLNATFLGSGSAINVDPTIDPGADALFGLPGDEDWYRIVPQFNGDLDIRVFFRQQGLLANGRAGLPGDGNLDIALYDADGSPVEIAGTGTFGTNDADDDERIRIPAVAGQTYYLRIKGAPLASLSADALNIYNLSVINTPAATPIDLELDDVIGVATVDAAPAASATQFDATATAPFVLSTVNDFYNGKDVAFTSGNLNGIRGRVLDYIGATQTFVFAAGTFFAAPSAGSTFQIESPDTGRSQFDNITRDTTPTIFLRVPNVVNVGGVATLDDVPFNGGAPGAPPDEFIGIPFVPTPLPQVVDATGPGFRVAIFVTELGTSDEGPPNNVLAGYASPVDPVNRPGLFTFTFSEDTLLTELEVFEGTSETTSFFISARVEMIDPAQPQQAQGYGDYAQSLEIVVDTQPPPVFFGLPNDPDDGLLPGSDTGLNTNPETLNDGVTSDTTPGFFGQAEADAVIRLFVDAPEPGFPTGDGVFEPAIDFQVGFDVAEPFDGTNQFPNGYWQVDSINFDLNAPPFPTDGLRRIFVIAEDVAGNINSELAGNVQELEIFIDTQGPQITDVTVNAPSGTVEGDDYDLFDPKPSTDGPTPLVNSIFIEIQDLPNRVVPGFDQPAFKPDIADNPGHYLVTGDYNGIIPILDVNVILDPAVNGQPATGRVQLIFRTPGADGVFNTSDDIGAALPDDRFTLFVNDEGIIDFAGNIGDFESNADEPHDSPPGPGEPDVLGVDGVPTGDGLPGGDFLARFTVDTRPELGVWAAGSAFLDLNGNTIWDPDNEDFTNRDITHTMGFVSDDLFSGRFATGDGEGGLFDDGFDKLGAYGRVGTNTFRWLIDTDNDGVADIEQPDPANVNGLPVAGNFALGSAGDEVGLFTGTTWHFDTNHNFQVDTSIAWPVAGSAIVGDFDGDGFDDLGTWTNDTFSFDLSSIGPAGPVAALNNPGLGTGVNGTIDRTFRFGFAGPGERPVAADMNQDGIDDVGLWMPARDGITPRGQAEWYFLVSGVTQNDTEPFNPENLGPTITGSNDPTPGSYLANPALYGLDNYTTGRIVIDPLFPNTNVVRFQPVPFGNDLSMNFGDDFALPLVGNFDPPTTPTQANPPGDPPTDPPADPPRDAYDVNDDGNINTIDLLAVLNYLTTNGISNAPSGGFTGAPYVDVNADLIVNTTDLLVLLNYLTQNPPVGASGEGEAGAEGEGGSANDEFFARLGSGDGSATGEDDDLIDLLAGS